MVINWTCFRDIMVVVEVEDERIPTFTLTIRYFSLQLPGVRVRQLIYLCCGWRYVIDSPHHGRTATADGCLSAYQDEMSSRCDSWHPVRRLA